MELVECAGCRRHVFAADPACPFCGATVVVPPRRAPRAVRSLTRAAIFYLGASVASGCGTEATEPPVEPLEQVEQIAQPYGAPPEEPPLEPPEPEDPPEPEPEDETAEPEAALEVEPVVPEEVPTQRRRVRRPVEERAADVHAADVDGLTDLRHAMPYGTPPIADDLV